MPNIQLRNYATSKHVFEASSETYDQQVVKNDKPVVVDCYADWCGPCKALAPRLESAIDKLGGAVLMAKVDVDKHPTIAETLQVTSIPAIFGYKDGKIVSSFTGIVSEDKLNAFLKDLQK